MPEVTFYHLGSQQTDRRLHFACRLTAKAFQDPKAMIWLRAVPAQTELLNDWLWTFAEGSFLPHQAANLPPEPLLRIFLGESAPLLKNLIIINLIKNIPETNQASRILEILLSEDTHLHAGRERYRAYQQAGCHIAYHQLPDY